MNLQEIIDKEKDLLMNAESKYGNYFINALDYNDLLNNFLKEVSPDAHIFILFLSQIKKHHTLALFSEVRLHMIQSKMNIRHIIESTTNAAYGLANPDGDEFVKKEDGILEAPEELQNKRYKWLEENYEDKSYFLKKQKDIINDSMAHSNLIYSFLNFDHSKFNKGKFMTPFFDKREKYMVELNLWFLGNLAMGALYLFYGVNNDLNKPRIHFRDDFLEKMKKLENENHRLKEKLAEENPKLKKKI